LYEFGIEEQGRPYLVMELLGGETLRQRLRQGELTFDVARAYARQLAGALGVCHEAGIVHRDIKPENIFVIRDPEFPERERVKVIDFGVAKLTEVTEASVLTDTGIMLGTPAYAAPEQWRGQPVDARSDVYSLGCVLFEMVA